jgi:L-galactose dehydrogenase
MRTRRLGQTSLQVSELGFGAAPLGDEYGTIDPRAGERAVAYAIDRGITFFDVAPYYGRTLAEERLGPWLQGKRDRVVLSTKVGRYGRDLPDGFDFSAARVARSVEESLRRLRTDVIDLYLAHDIEFGRREVILGETLPAMRALQLQGKVRYIGVSGFPLEHVRDIADAGGVDVILSYCHCNLLNTRLRAVLAPFVARRGIGLINASVLHMGVLTRAGPPAWHPAPPHVLQAARDAADWCSARGADIAELALAFALSCDGVASTLVGMRSEAEVHANLRALEADPDDDIVAGVRARLAVVQDVEWPVGLPENNPEVVASV